uniref:Cyclin_C domain-containing protein n=1 Tax=Mesocestoides corti TaxID=53468 RepID=A0A5K3G118_MESCO
PPLSLVAAAAYNQHHQPGTSYALTIQTCVDLHTYVQSLRERLRTTWDLDSLVDMSHEMLRCWDIVVALRAHYLNDSAETTVSIEAMSYYFHHLLSLLEE